MLLTLISIFPFVLPVVPTAPSFPCLWEAFPKGCPNIFLF
nr:MAG TPA: hypothetical protein [Caudoviricetes sp.]